MKKIILFILFVLPFVINAQEKQNSIPSTPNTKDSTNTIQPSEPNALTNNQNSAEKELSDLKIKYDSLQKENTRKTLEITTLNKKNDELNNKNNALNNLMENIQRYFADELNNKNNTLNNKYNELQKIQMKRDTLLFNISIDLLFKAYDADGINNVAKPAFESIYNSKLKEDHSIEISLIKAYKSHIEEFIAFLDYAKKELNNPFTLDSNISEELHKKSFYKEYPKYKIWKDTYLGKKIVDIEKAIEDFRKNKNKENLKQICTTIETELKACKKTEEDL